MMSQFGGYLRSLLEERGSSISELSRMSGVERTSLQKSLTGSRILSHEAVEKIIWSLQLTPEESKKLRYYYEIYFIGEERYKSRKMIYKMLEHVGAMRFNHFPGNSGDSANSLDFREYSSNIMNSSLVTGIVNVRILMQSIFERELLRENPEIELTMPADMKFINESLLYLFQKHRAKIKVSQMIAIHRNKSEKSLNLHSLECFAHLLPICLISNKQYYPYYYYDDSVSELYTDPFPYFLVTEECVLCMAADGGKALLLNNTEYAAYYRKHFNLLKDQCHALVNYSESLFSSLGEYSKVYDPDNMYVCIHQPCFPCECSNEEIRGFIRKDIYGWEKISEVCVNWLSSLRNVGKYHEIFQAEGVVSFMEEGHIDDFPEIAETVAPEKRLELLERMIISIEKEDRITARMFNDEKFTYPSFLSLSVSLKNGIGIFTTSRFGAGLPPICIHVNEPDLSEAFYDFILSLPFSELTCSKEETLKYLKDILQIYKNKFS